VDVDVGDGRDVTVDVTVAGRLVAVGKGVEEA
jgi:hypothetical protein